MSGWLIVALGIFYLIIAASFACDGKYGMAVMFLAYALANVGLWMETH